LRKYIFKTCSEDQRPIKHCDGTWAIIGAGLVNKKPYWQIVMWLEEGDDVFNYYPEAFDVSVQLDKKIEIKRGSEHHIITCYKTLGFVDGIKYYDSEINPTLISIIQKLSYDGLSPSTIAKRAGINFLKFQKLLKHPLVNKAIQDGRDSFIEDLAKSI
jgi:hypothetical protein